MKNSFRLCVLLLVSAAFLGGQTVVNGGRIQIGPWDASGATYTIPAKRGTTAQLPATCTQGAEYFATDAAPGQNIYLCTATNTWTQQLTGTSTFLQLGAGAVTRTVTSKLQDVVHVKDFGAKGDGVTDDSAAFTAALASGGGEVRADDGTYVVNSVITLAKGQKIYFGVGTHTVGGIRFSDSLTDQTGTGKIECAGPGVTTLMLKNGANVDVISQTNFAALTGQNSTFGLFRGEIRGCTIDGNKINQTGASYGIRLYGHGLEITDVSVRNAYSDGIYTEWGLDSTFATPYLDLEGYFTGIRSAFNNGNGWTFRGPHDSDFVEMVLYQNGGWGMQVQTSTTYNGNGHLSNLNAFLNTLGGVYSNSSLDGSQIMATTATGWGMLIDAGAGSHNFSAAEFAGPVGLEVRAPSQIISGNVVNTTTAGLRLNGGSGNFTLQMFNNSGYQIDFANEVGPSVISADSANPVPGTLFNGTPNQADYVFVDFGGSASGRYTSLPVQTVHVAGWAPQFPQSNSVMAVINDTTQTGNLSATNLTLSNSAQVGSSTYANLGSGANGTILYCSNCTQTAACAAGGSGAMAMYVNGAWSCAGGGSGGGGSYTFRNNLTNTAGTVDFTPLDSTVMNAVEEFLPGKDSNGQLGTLHWDVVTLGSYCTDTMIQGVANHPGILSVDSSSTAGTGCSLTLSDATDGAVYAFANLGSGGAWSYWEAQAIFQTDSSSVAHAQYLVGFSDNQSAYHPSGGNEIAVRYDSAGGGCPANESTTNWVYEVIVAGTKTCVNSGLAVAANTWYHVRIYSLTQGTIQFQIDSANSGSVAAAPTATLTPQFINLSTGVSPEGLSVDWWAMKMQGLTR
ncbi:MAG TPA: glycosyl hydrolase family 28-related protein [Bryobacteraceae bacterium]|nr:glycosyl hydrolase family 28-related protein [Bryobacteraceae bacterium]